MTYETKRLPGTINKAYKFQLRPNKEQQGLLAKAFGCARFVYNYFLNLSIDTYKKTKKGLSYEDQAKLLVVLKKNPEYEWLKEVPSQTLQQSLINLRAAYTNFFKKRAKFPKFKKKHNTRILRQLIKKHTKQPFQGYSRELYSRKLKMSWALIARISLLLFSSKVLSPGA